MQRDINVAIGNCHGKYGLRKYLAHFKSAYGSIGSYYCEAETLQETIEECLNVAKKYPKTGLGLEEKIIPLSISELHKNGIRTTVYEF